MKKKEIDLKSKKQKMEAIKGMKTHKVMLHARDRKNKPWELWATSLKGDVAVFDLRDCYKK